MSRLTVRLAIGLILGAALVAWVGPDSPAAATFLIVLSCLAVVIVDSLMAAFRAKGGS